MKAFHPALLFTAIVLPIQTMQAQVRQATTVPAPKLPERAIRNDIPMSNMIRRAFTAGTRDSSGRPGRNYWQLWMDYTINARLDPTTQRLIGRETIVLNNPSPDALTQIRMRLDQNIFRATVPRGAATPAETTDGMVITKLVVNGQAVDLNAQGRGGRGGGRGGFSGDAPPTPVATGLTTTNASIVLPSPIPAHGKGTIEVEWNFKAAGGAGAGHRMTARWGDSTYQFTQWYPRVAVYDDTRGWDADPYLGPSEFYNNFGHFDVRIDVPGGWIVGGTGVLQNPQEVLTPTARERLTHILESDATQTIVGPDEGGPGKATAAGERLTWHFAADTVNDFAWVTAKQFVWQATRATIPTRGPIPLHLLFLPGNAAGFAAAAANTRHALEFYSKLWMPDPFAQLTVADGPDNGMEYPMIIMSNQGPADHETGHQWWPMTVSNNETWYGWMDEGFNQYMNILSALDRAGAGGGRGGAAGGCSRTLNPPGGVGALNCSGQSYGNTQGSETEGTLMWDANYGGPGYSYQAYSKTPLMLSMLGGVVGDSAVWHAMSDWAKTWRFKHATPWDYAFFMSNTLKKDLGWFWYHWLFVNESVDGSIEGVTTVGPRTSVLVKQAGQMPAPVVIKVDFDSVGPAIRPMANSVVTGNSAIVTYPVEVWWSGKRAFSAQLNFGGRKIVSIQLDPFGRFPDHDVADNVWPRSGAAPASGGGRRGRGG